MQQTGEPKPAMPLFEEMENRERGHKKTRRCLACTLAAGVNIPAKGHKGLCTEAMIYAGMKPAVLKELKHLNEMYKPSVHDNMSRERAWDILRLAYYTQAN